VRRDRKGRALGPPLLFQSDDGMSDSKRLQHSESACDSRTARALSERERATEFAPERVPNA